MRGDREKGIKSTEWESKRDTVNERENGHYGCSPWDLFFPHSSFSSHCDSTL